MTTPRESLTAALHAHTCHPDGEACAWAGEDYPGDGTCSDVGEVGIEDAVLGWAIAHGTGPIAADHLRAIADSLEKWNAGHSLVVDTLARRLREVVVGLPGGESDG